MLKVPAKYKRCGIKVKCMACKWQVSDTCKQNNKCLNSCPNRDSHRYNLIVCVPNSPGSRRTKVLDTKDFSVALTELHKFKSELESNGFHKSSVTIQKDISKPTLLDYATSYLNTMTGENTPAILVRKRSKEHVDDITRTLIRFGTSLKKAGYNYKSLELKDIGDVEVSVFHEYLLEELKLKTRSYNKHISAMRTFYNWAARVKDYRGSNPFNHIELKKVPSKEKSIISKDEFNKFLNVLTFENGIDTNSKNHFKEWLSVAYRLAIETGLRREELVMLRWNDIIPLEGGKFVFQVNNLKVNRIGTGEDEGEYLKNVPITKSLMLLLVELGFQNKKHSSEFIIHRVEGTDVKYMMATLTRSFTHFVKQVITNRKVEFKDLRKTYITHLTLALGENAKLFTGHTNNQVLKSHYLNGAFIAGNLSDFSVFGEENAFMSSKLVES